MTEEPIQGIFDSSGRPWHRPPPPPDPPRVPAAPPGKLPTAREANAHAVAVWTQLALHGPGRPTSFDRLVELVQVFFQFGIDPSITHGSSRDPFDQAIHELQETARNLAKSLQAAMGDPYSAAVERNHIVAADAAIRASRDASLSSSPLPVTDDTPKSPTGLQGDSPVEFAV